MGVVRPSLYQITNVILSSSIGGVTSQGILAVDPCTASMKFIGTERYKTVRYTEFRCNVSIIFMITVVAGAIDFVEFYCY